MIRSVVFPMLSDSDIRERLGPLSDPDSNPDPTPHRPSAGRIAALAILVLLLWGSGIALIWHLARVSPHAPDSPSGHVFRLTDTRHTVYLTEKQWGMTWGAIGVPFVATIGVAFFSRRRKRPDSESY